MRKPTQEILELKKEVDQDWARERRIDFLKRGISRTVIETWENMAKYEHFDEVGCTEMKIIASLEVTEGVKKLVKQWRNIISLNKNTNSITDEMIQTAKDYPFEDLYPFKRGMALCPFHPDSKPSMSLKNNRVRCWSCSKSWDTIQFLIDLEGLSFPMAVSRLQ